MATIDIIINASWKPLFWNILLPLLERFHIESADPLGWRSSTYEKVYTRFNVIYVTLYCKKSLPNQQHFIQNVFYILWTEVGSMYARIEHLGSYNAGKIVFFSFNCWYNLATVDLVKWIHSFLHTCWRLFRMSLHILC